MPSKKKGTRNKPSQVRNRKRKIKAKRPVKELDSGPVEAASPGSARLDKATLIEGALPAVTENALVARMVSYDRVIWPVTEAAKVKAVKRSLDILECDDPKAINGAVRNLLAMESQNVEALKEPTIVQHNTNVQINMQVNSNTVKKEEEIPPVEMTNDTRRARIHFILSEQRRQRLSSEVAQRTDAGNVARLDEGAVPGKPRGIFALARQASTGASGGGQPNPAQDDAPVVGAPAGSADNGLHQPGG